MKKLERQQAQEEQAKLQQEEEAAAQREDQGEQAGSWAGTSIVISGRDLRDKWVQTSCPDGEIEAQRMGKLSTNLLHR